MTNEKKPKITTAMADEEAKKTSIEGLSPEDIIAHFAEEYAEEMNMEIRKGCIEFQGKKFFLNGLMKGERLFERVLPRILWETRRSCPLPTFDQSVYICDPKTNLSKELWVLPAGNVYNTILISGNNGILRPDEMGLYYYCRDFKSKKLHAIANSFLKKGLQ